MQDILKKLKFKDTAIVINAPKALEAEFERLGVRTSFDNNLKSANTLIFINNKQEFLDFLDGPMQNIETDSVLWFAYPKGTSKIKTDINREQAKVSASQECLLFQLTPLGAHFASDPSKRWGNKPSYIT